MLATIDENTMSTLANENKLAEIYADFCRQHYLPLVSACDQADFRSDNAIGGWLRCFYEVWEQLSFE